MREGRRSVEERASGIAPPPFAGLLDSQLRAGDPVLCALLGRRGGSWLGGRGSSPCGAEQENCCGCELGLGSDCHSLVVHADLLAILGGVFEADCTVNQCEKRVVPTQANVVARPDNCPALSHDDGASQNHLAVAPL